jgi:hypothetical protein
MPTCRNPESVALQKEGFMIFLKSVLGGIAATIRWFDRIIGLAMEFALNRPKSG